MSMYALTQGVPPAQVRPGSLLGYWPIWGIADPEIDLTANNNPCTLVGTAPLADHAPVGCTFPVAA